MESAPVSRDKESAPVSRRGKSFSRVFFLDIVIYSLPPAPRSLILHICTLDYIFAQLKIYISEQKFYICEICNRVSSTHLPSISITLYLEQSYWIFTQFQLNFPISNNYFSALWFGESHIITNLHKNYTSAQNILFMTLDMCLLYYQQILFAGSKKDILINIYK